MAKTKDELDALKAEVENLNRKLAELNEKELAQVVGGEAQNLFGSPFSIRDSNAIFENHIYGEETREEAENKFFWKTEL